MKKTLIIFKPEGVSPLSALDLFRQKYPEYKDVKMGYAGRLDPMAEGLLLILVGAENKKKLEYENLEKEYIVEVLCGIETDSYDVLGIVQKAAGVSVERAEFEEVCKEFVGEIHQRYPAYSAPKIKGKSLFALARENKLDESMIPVKKRTIESIEVVAEATINSADLLTSVIKRLERVEGDFRQEECIKRWEEVLVEQDYLFSLFTIKVCCSSGTYMRSLAHDIGEKLGTGALAYKIKRTRVGEFEELTPGVEEL